LAFIFYGLHKGALEPSQRAFVSELVPQEIRASALGGYQMIIGLFSLPASFLAGILWDKIGIFTPFLFSLFLTILSLILLFNLKVVK
jgi:MFS family permease